MAAARQVHGKSEAGRWRDDESRCETGTEGHQRRRGGRLPGARKSDSKCQREADPSTPL